jgi:hypothetical protein
MKIFTFFLTIFFFQLLPLTTASAAECKCPPMATTEVTFKNSDLVMIGTVSEVIINSAFKPGFSEITFDIRKLLKADNELQTSKVVVYVPNNECKPDFQQGFDYIVYAKGDILLYQTDSCVRNRFFDNAYEEIDKLKKITEK